MARSRPGTVVAASLACALLVGCSGRPEDQSTPRRTVAKMIAALRSADRDAWIDCHRGPGRQLKLAGAIYDMCQTGMRLREALIALHGPEGWATFERTDVPTTAGADFQLGLSPVPATDSDAEHRIAVEVDGETARYAADGLRGVLTLRDGVWAHSMAAFEGEEKVWTARFERMAAVYGRGLVLIEHGTTDPTELKRLLTAQLNRPGGSD
jgi:hypothetical protein